MFIRLLKEREALHTKGKDYKEAVGRYLSSKGLSIEQDSTIEGTFEDLVLYSAIGFRVCVECKDTEVSLASEEVVVPLLRYLNQYLNSPPEARFRTNFFFSRISDRDAFDRLFNNRSKESIEAFRGICIRIYDHSSPQLKNRMIDPHAPKLSQLKVFLSDCDVYEATFDDLERAVRLRERAIVSRPLYGMLTGLAEAQKALADLALPDAGREDIVSNLLPAQESPSQVWRVPLTLVGNRIDELLNAGPAIVKEGNIYTFVDPNPFISQTALPLGGSHVEKIGISEWTESESTARWYIELLNKFWLDHLKRLGLEESERKRRFCLFSRDGKEIHRKWHPGGKASSRYMTKPFLDVAGNINFWAHRAISGRFRQIGSGFYLELEPTWVFTENGLNCVSSSRETALFRFWRKRERNQTKLGDLLFWIDLLKQGKDSIELQSPSFTMKLGNAPLSIPVEWTISGDYRKDQGPKPEMGEDVADDEDDLSELEDLDGPEE